MFIWGQVRTGTPFYFPNRDALLDLYSEIVGTPGVEQHVLSHATIAPAVVDPVLIRQLSALLLDNSPIHLASLSTHPQRKALVPLIGLETGSVHMAKQIMPSKGVPFPIDEWPSVVIQGLTVLNENNRFPAMTLMVGNPGETDPPPVAAHHEVLEDEPAARADGLVGADGVARGRSRPLGRTAAQAEWTELHVATLHVRQRGPGTRDGSTREDPRRASHGD